MQMDKTVEEMLNDPNKDDLVCSEQVLAKAHPRLHQYFGSNYLLKINARDSISSHLTLCGNWREPLLYHLYVDSQMTSQKFVWACGWQSPPPPPQRVDAPGVYPMQELCMFHDRYATDGLNILRFWSFVCWLVIPPHKHLSLFFVKNMFAPIGMVEVIHKSSWSRGYKMNLWMPAESILLHLLHAKG